MNSFDEFRMGDSLWAYLKSKSDNRHELEKREDVGAEIREGEGLGCWENSNPWQEGAQD